MRRRFTPHAEILRGSDQSPPKEMLPDVIRSDATCQRIGRIDQPSREVEPVRHCFRRFERMQRSQDARTNFISLTQEIAADMNESLHAIGGLLESLRLGLH